MIRMLPRTSLIRVQRDLYQKMKSNARSQFGGLSPKLQSYFEVYQRDMRDFECYSSTSELIESIHKSHICLVGDYHTLSQAQRMLLRLMRNVLPRCQREGRDLCLMLEMLSHEDTATANRFLQGKITEKRFLKDIQYHRHWGFFWPHYRPLFQFARQHEIEVVGINTSTQGKTLEGRDTAAAEIIAKHAAHSPNTLHFVHIGDLHLAAPHLPRKLKDVLSREGLKLEMVTIHQNAERFYWKLVESGTETLVDTVKVRQQVYCVLNTPPWLKLQSHLHWNELSQSQKKHISESATELGDLDFSDEVLEYLHTIRQFIGIEGDFVRSRFEDFEIQGPVDLDFVSDLTKQNTYTAAEIKVLLAALVAFDSVFIPKVNYLFTSRIQANQYAYLASLFLQSKLSGYSQLFSVPQKHFFPFILTETVGFLGSKIINPKRKCKSEEELKSLANGLKGKDSQKAAELVLQVLAGTPVKIPKKLFIHDVVTFYQAARWLGGIFGEWHYQNLITGKRSRNHVRNLFLKYPSHALAKKQVSDWVKEWSKLGN